MSDKKKVVKYVTVDELLRGAKKSTMLAEVREEIAREDELELSDAIVAQELENWSAVAGKVMGHEDE